MRWIGYLPLWIWAQYQAPRLMGVGDLQAVLIGEILSANPACALPVNRLVVQAASAFYLPAPELNMRLGGVAYRWDTLQGFSLLIQQWNFDKITQGEGGLTYALRLLQQRLTLAVRGRVLSTNFSEYGRLYRGTPDIGFTFQISSRFLIGGYGYNLLAQGWGFLPGSTQYGVGVAYIPSPSAQLLTEISQREGAMPEIRTAFLYTPHSALALRGGVGLPLLSVGGGASLSYKRIALDIGYRYHPAVGSWISAGLSYAK